MLPSTVIRMRGSVPTHRLSLIFDFFEQKKKKTFFCPRSKQFHPLWSFGIWNLFGLLKQKMSHSIPILFTVSSISCLFFDWTLLFSILSPWFSSAEAVRMNNRRPLLWLSQLTHKWLDRMMANCVVRWESPHHPALSNEIQMRVKSNRFFPLINNNNNQTFTGAVGVGGPTLLTSPVRSTDMTRNLCVHRSSSGYFCRLRYYSNFQIFSYTLCTCVCVFY
jgi:hypothetical protein